MSVPAERMSAAIDLRQLLRGMAVAPPLPVAGLTDDSRRLKAGDVFVALPGDRSHGLDYLPRALQQGVAAVLWDPATAEAPANTGAVPLIAVDKLADNLGELANRYYDSPSHAVDVVGITGTNGKTTVAFLVAQCFQRLGLPCGYIGTLGSGIETLSIDSGLTTPPCLELHAGLAEFRDAGAAHAAIEVSSHALVQNRPAGIRFNAAVFTNLSRDHVDYHGDMQRYAGSKLRLFTDFECTHRIVNADDEYAPQFIDRCGDDAILTSTRGPRVSGRYRFLHVRSGKPVANGMTLDVSSSWGRGKVDLPLTGEFNVSNALQVMAVLLANGIDFADCCDVMSMLSAPPGRMQRVQTAADASLPAVFVDYAHTPAALEAALTAMRPHVAADLWCVFGCGGDRDAGKRPQMGRIAEQLADRVIVTNDNPRGESPQAIIADVMAGMTDPALAIEDRAAAIAHAVAEAGPSDAVLIAGKGHEDYQIIGNRRLDFSDYQAARANLDARLRTCEGRR